MNLLETILRRSQTVKVLQAEIRALAKKVNDTEELVNEMVNQKSAEKKSTKGKRGF